MKLIHQISFLIKITTRIAECRIRKFSNKRIIFGSIPLTLDTKIFGLIHKRLVHLDLNNYIIRGADSFGTSNKFSEDKNHNVFIRFHIHPSIELNVTTSKKSCFEIEK